MKKDFLAEWLQKSSYGLLGSSILMTDLIQGVYQGLFMPLSEIKVSPLSRAYTFSDSIYEVIPYYSGKPLCLDEHIDRFKLSADFLKIELDLVWKYLLLIE